VHRWRSRHGSRSALPNRRILQFIDVQSAKTVKIIIIIIGESPLDPKFVRAFERAIRPGWHLRSMTPEEIRNLRARDRPMQMRNASVVLDPMTRTRGVAEVPSGAMRTAVALTSRRWWTTCAGTQSRRLGRCCRLCTYSLGRGSVHSASADSVVASKILQ
jgi:hypothetical protein